MLIWQHTDDTPREDTGYLECNHTSRNSKGLVFLRHKYDSFMCLLLPFHLFGNNILTYSYATSPHPVQPANWSKIGWWPCMLYWHPSLICSYESFSAVHTKTMVSTESIISKVFSFIWNISTEIYFTNFFRKVNFFEDLWKQVSFLLTFALSERHK